MKALPRPTRLGRRLRAARLAHGMTGERLAALSGVPQNTIYDIELGWTRSPSFANVAALAEVLRLSLTDLAKDCTDEQIERLTRP